MKTTFLPKIVFAGLLAWCLTACTDDLDLVPRYEMTSATVYNDFNNYKHVLAKLYAGYAVTGQQGPDGLPDLSGFDEGKSNYIRAYWQLQELPTDEAVIAWNDGTIFDLHDMDWTSSNEYIRMMYDRIYYQIALCNEFIRETADDKLGGRGISGTNAEQARQFRAEARFLRALSYWHALDLFGNVPFVTENDAVGAFFPRQISRADLFAFVEQELLALENELAPARQQEYGRADQGALWMLLAKLYLNAEAYTGQARYGPAVTYSKKVIDAGYRLEPNYRHLFLADNHLSPEIIFPVAFDGQNIRTWGGTTFLVNAPLGPGMNFLADFGVSGGWAGLRTTSSIVNLFPDVTGTADKRAVFFTAGRQLEINNIPVYTEGYPITKYRNVTRTGQPGSNPVAHPDTDFPMFRLADAYLMYAEATLRGGGGDAGLALGLVNQLRQRAYGSAAGNIQAHELTLEFILDERARELNWEAHRRQDLIRYNLFTSDAYRWPWKGGAREGKGVEAFRSLYPLPVSDLTANPNLKQNTGY